MNKRKVEISFRQYLEWTTDDYPLVQRERRFGQEFYNRFINDGIPWPELYHAKTRKEAQELIYEYVEFTDDRMYMSHE